MFKIALTPAQKKLCFNSAQVVLAGGITIALFHSLYLHPDPHKALPVGVASCVAWAIGSIIGGPPWWNGSSNIIAAWLAVVALTLQYMPGPNI